MFLINLIPGCHFRATEEAEIVGMDEAECGECELPDNRVHVRHSLTTLL